MSASAVAPLVARERPRPSGPWAIEVTDLHKRFGELHVLKGLRFQVAPGECLGLLGPNGAGKTTTLEILEGIQAPSSGTVRVLGREWASQARALRERIGVQFQHTDFYPKGTVRETLALFRSFFSQGLAVDEALELLQLREKEQARVMHLSGGQRQRLALAVAMIGNPELLFLDEPTTGLDPQSRHALWQTVEALKDRGQTVVLTTHYMEEAERLCDRLIIVDHGQIIAEGTPAALIASLEASEFIELSCSTLIPAEQWRSVPGVLSAHLAGERVRLATRELHQTLPALLRLVQSTGGSLAELTTRRATLDDLFLKLTGHSLREDAS